MIDDERYSTRGQRVGLNKKVVKETKNSIMSKEYGGERGRTQLILNSANTKRSEQGLGSLSVTCEIKC